MGGHAGAMKGVSWFRDNMGRVRMSDVASHPPFLLSRSFHRPGKARANDSLGLTQPPSPRATANTGLLSNAARPMNLKHPLDFPGLV